MFKHNIKGTLNKDRPDKTGAYPFRIRTTIKRKVTYYSTGIMLKPDQWNGKEVIKHPNKTTLNLVINKKIAEIEAQLLESALMGSDMPVKRNIEYKEYALNIISQRKRFETEGTIKHKIAYLNKFDRYKPGIKLQQVNSEVLRGYEEYCLKLGNSGNTVWSSVKNVLTVLNLAEREGLIKKVRFDRTKYKNPERGWLTMQEIDKLEAYVKKYPNGSLARYANWFLFSCYSGLRYSDLQQFTPDKIKAGKIILRTEKTGTDVSIKIHPRLKECIKRMEPEVYTNQEVNRGLKALADAVGINKKITYHLGRYSFAVNFLENSGSMEVLSKLLGHSSMKTTLIYGKLTDKRMDAEIENAFK